MKNQFFNDYSLLLEIIRGRTEDRNKKRLHEYAVNWWFKKDNGIVEALSENIPLTEEQIKEIFERTKDFHYLLPDLELPLILQMHIPLNPIK
ncbi:MAG: hypothetical protein LIO65_07655 [Odoribacter sp.]|nr:hypothetical protein [Odoribacter sp.]